MSENKIDVCDVTEKARENLRKSFPGSTMSNLSADEILIIANSYTIALEEIRRERQQEFIENDDNPHMLKGGA